MAVDKLVDSTQLDADLTTIANAIRTKGGTSAQLAFPQGMADAIAAIPSGGTEITDGIVVKARDADGYATEIDFYGSTIYRNTFGVDLTYTTTRKTAYSEVTTINWKSPITEVKESAFTPGFNGLTSITLPQNPCVFGRTCFGQYQPKITNVNLPGGGTFTNSCFRQWEKLQSIVLGSVGYPVLSLHNKAFDYDTQTALTITAFCDGGYADTLLANIRNGATNATIIIKASENTTYNGTAYAAGDTMITSTP